MSVVHKIKLIYVHVISPSLTAGQLHVIVHSLTVGEWRERRTHIPSIDFIQPPKYHILWRLMCCTPTSPWMFDLQSQCQFVVLTILYAWLKRFRCNSGSIPSVPRGLICFTAFSEFWNSCAYLQNYWCLRIHKIFYSKKWVDRFF